MLGSLLAAPPKGHGAYQSGEQEVTLSFTDRQGCWVPSCWVTVLEGSLERNGRPKKRESRTLLPSRNDLDSFSKGCLLMYEYGLSGPNMDVAKSYIRPNQPYFCWSIVSFASGSVFLFATSTVQSALVCGRNEQALKANPLGHCCLLVKTCAEELTCWVQQIRASLAQGGEVLFTGLSSYTLLLILNKIKDS